MLGVDSGRRAMSAPNGNVKGRLGDIGCLSQEGGGELKSSTPVGVGVISRGQKFFIAARKILLDTLSTRSLSRGVWTKRG